MIRGIHRFVVTIGPKVVKVRAQSVSAKGQAYTVRAARVHPKGKSKSEIKAAVTLALSEVYSTI